MKTGAPNLLFYFFIYFFNSQVIKRASEKKHCERWISLEKIRSHKSNGHKIVKGEGILRVLANNENNIGNKNFNH